MRKVISEGPSWFVEREGDEEFCNFEGSFGDWVVHELTREGDERDDTNSTQEAA